MRVIDTVQDYHAAKGDLEPVFIESAEHGRVEVPCCNTWLVNRSLVLANGYNPNFVSSDKMELLRQSILDNGFCFPVVAIFDEDEELFVIIDGFHRYTIGGDKWLKFSHIPVVVLRHDMTKRMVATHQFNKARGVHQVDLDADIIRALIQQGMSEEDISVHLGIDMEAIHRYKSLTGIAELFRNSAYSLSWEMTDVPDA